MKEDPWPHSKKGRGRKQYIWSEVPNMKITISDVNNNTKQEYTIQIYTSPPPPTNVLVSVVNWKFGVKRN